MVGAFRRRRNARAAVRLCRVYTSRPHRHVWRGRAEGTRWLMLLLLPAASPGEDFLFLVECRPCGPARSAGRGRCARRWRAVLGPRRPADEPTGLADQKQPSPDWALPGAGSGVLLAREWFQSDDRRSAVARRTPRSDAAPRRDPRPARLEDDDEHQDHEDAAVRGAVVADVRVAQADRPGAGPLRRVWLARAPDSAGSSWPAVPAVRRTSSGGVVAEQRPAAASPCVGG